MIATNTSAIPIRELAPALRSPERFVGTHWFNPPQWIPCVEVIAGPSTSPEVIAKTASLLTRLGKKPVVVGDAGGFVANRLQFAMYKEAVSIVADGVATPEQVDEVVRNSFGFRLPIFGPFMIADMAGLGRLRRRVRGARGGPRRALRGAGRAHASASHAARSAQRRVAASPRWGRPIWTASPSSAIAPTSRLSRLLAQLADGGDAVGDAPPQSA